MTGSDFKNSKWCQEGATESGCAKVRKSFESWTSRVGNYGLLGKARRLYEFFLSPKVAGTQKAIVVGALLYLISPLDFIPDFIPVVGWLDDIGVAAFALNYISATLGKLELSPQQVVDAEIVDEGRVSAFRIGEGPLAASSSASLRDRFEEVCDIARTLRVEGGDSVCSDLERMVFETRLFQVAVVGRYSTGKSTLLNALLGKDVLPSKPVPTTKAVTYLMKGTGGSIGAEYEDGTMRLEPITKGTSASDVYNDMTADKARAITIALLDFPFSDLVLIDTPGIEDPDENVVQETQELVHNCDAVVVMIDANYPQSRAEYEFIRSIADGKASRKIYVVVNKCDGKSPEQCREIKAKCLDELKRCGTENAEIYTLSALGRDEGFVSFRETLFASLRSGLRSDVAKRAISELDDYARSLRSACSSLLEAAAVDIKDGEEQMKRSAEKRRQVTSCFDRQVSTLSKKIDECKAQMLSDLANFIGGLKSEVRSAINASDFDTLKNTDAIAAEVNKKLTEFVSGQQEILGKIGLDELKKSGAVLRDELGRFNITAPKQEKDKSGLADAFFPVTITLSYLLFGLSTAFIGTLVFAVLGRKCFEESIRRILNTFGLQNARSRIADEVSQKLDDCEKKVRLQLSAAVESMREKLVSAIEARRFEYLSTCTPASPSEGLTPETIRNCCDRLTAVLGE